MNIIITGASKGIGLAIAKTFAKQNEKHHMGICSRKKDELGAAEAELREISENHEYFSSVCDVSQEIDVNTFVADFEKKSKEMIAKNIIVKSDPSLHPEQFDIH